MINIELTSEHKLRKYYNTFFKEMAKII